MGEFWKDIKGYEGLYQISNFGNIRNMHTNKFKKSTTGKNGYSYVFLYKHNIKTSYMLHRLVAESFLTNPYNKPQVNHKDGNKQNNNVENLEWVTCKENINHSIYKLGNKPKNNNKGKFGRYSKCSKKIAQYDKNGNLIKIYYGGCEAQRALGLSTCSHIMEVIKGTRKSAFGFYWKEVE